ncbi:hypothetical protein RCL1_002571 [Eukaryota sp. TZLM3-RCL]
MSILLDNEPINTVKNSALDTRRLLALVFLSTLHPDHSYVLTSLLPQFNHLTDRFVFWCATVNNKKNPEANHYATKYAVVSFPFCIVVDPSSMKALDSFPLNQSTHTPENIVLRLNTTHSALQMSSIAQTTEEDLRREQEAAFLEAEAAAVRRQQQMEEESRQVERHRQLKEKQADFRRNRFEDQSKVNEGLEGQKRIGVKLPNGNNITKQISPSMPLSFIYDWISVDTELDSESIILTTNFPKRLFEESESSLSDLGISDPTLFFVDFK